MAKIQKTTLKPGKGPLTSNCSEIKESASMQGERAVFASYESALFPANFLLLSTSYVVYVDVWCVKNILQGRPHHIVSLIAPHTPPALPRLLRKESDYKASEIEPPLSYHFSIQRERSGIFEDFTINRAIMIFAIRHQLFYILAYILSSWHTKSHST